MRAPLLLLLAACASVPTTSPPPDAAPIALTHQELGRVLVLDARTLQPLFAAEGTGRAGAPMHVVHDPARSAFYVGNLNGGLGRIQGSTVSTIDVGGDTIGLAISPDGKHLAVNGARDLTLRIVDLDSFTLRASVPLGDPSDPPAHSHLTHGLASTHPLWLDDDTVLTQDNVHEALVAVTLAGEVTKLPVGTPVHSFLRAGDTVIALGEGTVDGEVPPQLLVLAPGPRVERAVQIPLTPGEPAKLHHGALSADGEVAFVANMGPLHGERPGRTVAAVRWRTGEVLWARPVARNAGHVRPLPGGTLLVLGHRDGSLRVLSADTGAEREVRVVSPGAEGSASLGHALAVEPEGTALVIDADRGRLVRVTGAGVRESSPPLGAGTLEASLPE